MTEFNLLREGCIDTIDDYGNREMLSIIDVIQKSHTKRRLANENPLYDIAIYRMISVILMDSLRLTRNGWLEIWERGHFDEDDIEKIEKRNEGRFDLFDKKYPWMQAKSEIPTFSEKSNPDRIFFDISTTHGNRCFIPNYGSHKEICPICIFKQLSLINLYSFQGGVGYGTSLISNEIIVMPVGNNLFETIMMNYYLKDMEKNDLPIWQKEHKIYDKTKTESVLLLEGLTWQGRSVYLGEPTNGRCTLCHRDGIVIGDLQFGPGMMKTKDIKWIDPWISYNDEKSVRFDDKYPIYEKFDAIFNTSSRPKIIDRLASLVENDDLNISVDRWNLYALSANKASVERMYFSQFNINLRLLNNPVAMDNIHLFMVSLRKIWNSLKGVTRSHSDERSEKNAIDIKNMWTIFFDGAEIIFRAFLSSELILIKQPSLDKDVLKDLKLLCRKVFVDFTKNSPLIEQTAKNELNLIRSLGKVV